MSDYAAIYSVRMTHEQFAVTGNHPRLGKVVVEDMLGEGYYNLGISDPELVEEFIVWCKEHGIKPLLM